MSASEPAITALPIITAKRNPRGIPEAQFVVRPKPPREQTSLELTHPSSWLPPLTASAVCRTTLKRSSSRTLRM